MRFRRSTLAVFSLFVFPLATHAGGEKVAFPEGFEKGALYATVDRYDIKQFRELYSSKEAVDAIRKGQPIPSRHGARPWCNTRPRPTTREIPRKDRIGRFVKDGGVVAYTVMEKRTGLGSGVSRRPAQRRMGIPGLQPPIRR